MIKQGYFEKMQKEEMLYLGDRQIEMRRSMHKRYCIWRYLRYYRLYQYAMERRTDQTASYVQRMVSKYECRFFERKKESMGHNQRV